MNRQNLSKIAQAEKLSGFMFASVKNEIKLVSEPSAPVSQVQFRNV